MLMGMVLPLFSYRMNIRCFLSGFSRARRCAVLKHLLYNVTYSPITSDISYIPGLRPAKNFAAASAPFAKIPLENA